MPSTRPSLEEELGPILQAVTILSPWSYMFAGGPPGFVDRSGADASPATAHPLPSDPLIRAIQSLLYNRCYSRPFHDVSPSPLRSETSTPPPNADAGAVAA